ncbi:lasso peptide biosynthesis B2 protein [Paenibacillus sp. FSL K6-3182]|uniref:lasso peptide biosynthesis B2 protein n=1 Tax=unclassified Paenibacillus TaxID=185978 RepID=UPI0030CD154F
MGIIGKCKTVFSLDMKTLLLFIETGLYLGRIRMQLLYFPFSRIAPTLGVYLKETDSEYSQQNHEIIFNVYQSIEIMGRNTFWETKCLVRAITAMKMLERRQIESTLYLGTAKDENGKLIAHAWLRSGSLVVSGAEEMNRFTVTGMFAKFIQ